MHHTGVPYPLAVAISFGMPVEEDFRSRSPQHVGDVRQAPGRESGCVATCVGWKGVPWPVSQSFLNERRSYAQLKLYSA